MVFQGKGDLANSPHLLFFPGMAIFLTVLAFIFVGDGVRDALDPKLKGRYVKETSALGTRPPGPLRHRRRRSQGGRRRQLRRHRGEVFAIVGESGSGKSVTAMSMLGLIPNARIAGGEAMWKETDLLQGERRRDAPIRGGEIAMIFQDPLTALNPVHKIGRQIGEMVRIHRDASKKEARERAIELLDLVGIPQPERRVDNYPHEFSGGMRQRAMIAMAIACEPDLLIADEPTTALDVTVQAQVMEVLMEIKDRIRSSIILITHDLGLVAGSADRVMVMYAGRPVELPRGVTVVPSSTGRPAYITKTRSAPPATTPRSWVMSTMAELMRSLISIRTSRTCACTVTSSAVVGSSAMRRSGSQAMAMAIIAR